MGRTSRAGWAAAGWETVASGEEEEGSGSGWKAMMGKKAGFHPMVCSC
jgi:hypothetical protein